MGANYFSKDNDDNENKLCWAETPDDLPINAYAKIDKPEFSVEVVPGGATAKVNCNLQLVFNISWICFTGVEFTDTIVKTDNFTTVQKVGAAAATIFGPLTAITYGVYKAIVAKKGEKNLSSSEEASLDFKQAAMAENGSGG